MIVEHWDKENIILIVPIHDIHFQYSLYTSLHYNSDSFISVEEDRIENNYMYKVKVLYKVQIKNKCHVKRQKTLFNLFF